MTHQPDGSHPAPSQAVAFAFVAGVEPLVGLQAAWIVGLIEQIFGDRPGMITGATGALAVVMPPLTRPCQRGCDQPGEGQLTGCPLGAPVDEDGCVTPQFASPEKLGLLFYAVILQGLIQLLCGFFKVGKLVSLLPHPVMVGFCNGLAIIIGLAQFEGFKRGEMGPSNPLYCATMTQENADFPESNIFATVLADEGAYMNYTVGDHCASVGRRQLGGGTAIFSDGHAWHDGQTLLFMILLLIIPTMITVHFLPKLLEKVVGNAQAVPSSLVAIALSMVIEHLILRSVDSDCDLVPDSILDVDGERSLWIGCGTKTVGEVAAVAGGFPVPIWFDTTTRPAYPGGPDVTLKSALPAIDGEMLSTILPISIVLAAIGLIESLMTQQLVNGRTATGGDPNRECIGQGMANVFAGALGSMGGCAMIGQSMINVTSGGKLRISGIAASLVLLMIILVASPIIDLIPMGGLIGVMFMVVYYTFEWGSLKFIATVFLPETTRTQAGLHTVKVNRADAITVVIATIVSTVHKQPALLYHDVVER